MNTLRQGTDAVGGYYKGSLHLVGSRVYWEAGGTGAAPFPLSLRSLLNHLSTTAQYAVTVSTGDVANAGTDADVLTTLHGGWGIDLPERKLDTPANDFERASTTKFVVSGPLIGPIDSVRIRHTNTGNAPGWFLDYITVQRVGSTAKYWFNCHRWLAWDEDDCAIDLLLQEFGKPTPTPGVPLKCAPNTPEKEQPAPQLQTGLGRVLIYNCSTQHRSIDIWLHDVTAQSGWKSKGTIEAQYSRSGVCPAGEPLAIDLEDGHVYYVHAVDTQLIGCPDGHGPGHPSCVRQAMWVKGKAGGAIVPWIVP